MTKVGRNDPCPCGSGKKYKRCCWGKVAAARTSVDVLDAPDPLSFNPRVTERSLADLHRLMAGRNLTSEVEIDAFLAE